MPNDIDFDPNAVQVFHDHFKMITENMIQNLMEIRSGMEQIHAYWNDSGYDSLKVILDETVFRLRNFIDNECQQDLQDLQVRINTIRETINGAYRSF